MRTSELLPTVSLTPPWAVRVPRTGAGLLAMSDNIAPSVSHLCRVRDDDGPSEASEQEKARLRRLVTEFYREHNPRMAYQVT